MKKNFLFPVMHKRGPMVGTSEEVAGFVLWLNSYKSSFVTGLTLISMAGILPNKSVV